VRECESFIEAAVASRSLSAAALSQRLCSTILVSKIQEESDRKSPPAPFSFKQVWLDL
jgi:hypothetical protein